MVVSILPTGIYMETPKLNIEKVRAISSYLSNEVAKLYVTKFYKLLYYIDFIAYAKRGSPVTGDLYYKLPYGPVPTLIKNEVDNLSSSDPEIKSQLIKNVELVDAVGDGTKHILNNITKEIDTAALSETEWNIVKAVVKKFQKTPSSVLSSRTHREAPYRLTSASSSISYQFANKLDVDSILA